MLNRIIKYSCLLAFVGLVMAGCRKLDSINHDPTKSTTTEPPYLLTGAEKSTMDILYSSLQNGYIGMHYAQFWSGNTRVADSQYSLDENNNGALWTTLYAAAHNLDLIRTLNADGANPAAQNQNAIAGILKVWIMQILTDAYVNVPYTQALDVTKYVTPAYDDAKTIYNQLTDSLTANINALDASKPTFGDADVIYKGDVNKWKTLGHSLMLRLAIRMADADNAKAKSLIEANYQGAMTSNSDNAEFAYLGADPNRYPMDETNRPIIDFYVSTTLTDYMRETSDPRLTIYARPVEGLTTDTIYGMPYGMSTTDPNRPTTASYPGTKIYGADMKGILMTYSEVAFTLAEAAARGYTVGGDAATYYASGVRASMNYWGVADSTANAYLAQVPYMSGDWKNVIGTQKWLSLYPQGFQAWFERIRLNFKKPGGADLFIAPVSGSLDQHVTMVPYRLTYPIVESNSNSTNYAAAGSAIGGDNKGTKNWWITY
ncbi:SusD/RagB family nutrient-binding outer membrane lipoprotein [Chitinophaga sp.]|uniref:SusD/RagB family nutrient-binding outer membrane lipoprotein n=1 Tax=Chitinophaga sp. TaxID=1869181 RepID=UPI0031DBA2E8